MADIRSSNPFRRKATTQPSDATATPPLSTATFSPSFDTSAGPVDPPPSQPKTSDYFRQRLQFHSQANQPPPSTTFQKPKVVKKVRVQSPPPSSPESASAVPDDYPTTGYNHAEDSDSSSSDDDEAEDPFRATAPPLGTISHGNYGDLTTSPPPITGRQPPNPFKKTLEDMEQGVKDVAQLQNTSTTPKGSLDVDAFKRLLMTGQAGVAGTIPPVAPTAGPQITHPPTQAADTASITDASSVSRQSIFDQTLVQETPRTSHEISEAEGDNERLGLINNPLAKVQQSTPSTLRKKPPPPSSRHGRLIKADPAQKPNNGGPAGDSNVLRPSSSSSQRGFITSPDANSPPSKQRPSPPSDVNKPLPPSPVPCSAEEGHESIFDREAAGKLPEVAELEPETDATITPPNSTRTTTAAAVPQDPRKPAPPPRRNPHHRSDSKASASAIQKAISPAGMSPTAGEDQRRSSHDSTLSRSSSMRANIHAPAPPPPRRPHHGPRPSASLTSPSTSSFTPTSSTGTTHVPLADHHLPSFPHTAQLSSEPVSPGPSPLHHQTSSLAPQPKAKLTAPPPPPARHSSVRSTGRPASVSSFDAPSRRMPGRERDGAVLPPPPPPPKRSRAGSGRGSSETGPPGRLLGGPVTEEPSLTASGAASPAPGGAEISPAPRRSEDKSADDILADLDALQREVDALRGQFEKVSGNGG